MAIELKGFGQGKMRDFPADTTNFSVDWMFPFDASWANSATVTRTDASAVTATFNPKQIEWRTPSEHTVDGVHYDAEV